MQLPHSSIWMKSVCSYLEMSICYFVNRAARVIPSVAPRMVAIMIRSVFSAKIMGGGIQIICSLFCSQLQSYSEKVFRIQVFVEILT